MKRVSVTGWVPKDEKEMETLRACGLSSMDLRSAIKAAIAVSKKEAIDRLFPGKDLKKVRVTFEIDVEEL